MTYRLLTKLSPTSEANLGKGSIKTNAGCDFLPKLDEWSQLCQSIQLGNEQFGAPRFVALLRQSTDLLIKDLADEIAIMEASRFFRFLISRQLTEPQCSRQY